MIRAKTVDVLTRVGDTRFLGTYPKQVGIVDIDALDAERLGDPLAVVDVSRLYGFCIMGVDIHPEQTQLVGANPDVTTLVAYHAVDVAVDADASHA